MLNIKAQLKTLPNSPGIYLFYNAKKELLYVGKATSLKNRVKSYFIGNQKSPRPIEAMIHEVVKIKTITTDSVLEAIILEGNYIKKFQPKYNVDWKDDKSWNYLYLTNAEFPKLKTIRQYELDKAQNKNNWKLEIGNWKFVYGPFPGLNTTLALKILHKLFYISRCEPQAKKPCFDFQLGYCLGVCVNKISPSEYQYKVIKPLVTFLSGHKQKLLITLKKEMLAASAQKNFEEAARLRDQILALKKIHAVALLDKEFLNIKTIDSTLKNFRIEAYDISNLGSSAKVGSLVVFNQHGPLKAAYRKFKIKTVVGQSDVDCLKEVLSRRFKNNWPTPDLILVDGGQPQVNAVKIIIRQRQLNVPVIGIAKGPLRKKNEFIFEPQNKPLATFIKTNQTLLIQARNEAHRFAVNYHHLVHKKESLASAFDKT